jgi:hypothetical protein
VFAVINVLGVHALAFIVGSETSQVSVSNCSSCLSILQNKLIAFEPCLCYYYFSIVACHPTDNPCYNVASKLKFPINLNTPKALRVTDFIYEKRQQLFNAIIIIIFNDLGEGAIHDVPTAHMSNVDYTTLLIH